MKAFTALAAVFAAAVIASAAIAAPSTSGSGGGNTQPKPPKGCKTVGVVLKGTVAAAPGANPTLPFGLKVTVASSNDPGAAYVSAAQPVTVTVTSTTTITRKGTAALSALLAGDGVSVKAKPCASDLAGGATPALTATDVSAKPAKQPKTHGKN
jgi:uncharacterized protein with beta-barrel porin domain